MYLLWWVHERGVSPAAVAAILAAGDIALTALEIPTGWLADRYGHRACLIAGSALQIVGMLLCWLGQGVPGLLAASLVVALGDAFRSGADQALLYRSCVALDRERDFQAIQARTRAATLSALVVLVLLGGAVVATCGLHRRLDCRNGVGCGRTRDRLDDDRAAGRGSRRPGHQRDTSRRRRFSDNRCVFDPAIRGASSSGGLARRSLGRGCVLRSNIDLGHHGKRHAARRDHHAGRSVRSLAFESPSVDGLDSDRAGCRRHADPLSGSTAPVDLSAGRRVRVVAAGDCRTTARDGHSAHERRRRTGARGVSRERARQSRRHDRAPRRRCRALSQVVPTARRANSTMRSGRARPKKRCDLRRTAGSRVRKRSVSFDSGRKATSPW